MRLRTLANLLVCATVILAAAVAEAKPQREGDHKRQPPRRQPQPQRREVQRDRREIQKDRREVQKDRQDLRKERREGGDTADEKRELRKDTRDLREDRRELRKDAAPGPERREEARERVVDRRQDRQERRIEHGVANGSLTAQELSTLQTQQQSIASLEQSFKSDGKLTGPEFRQLQQELNTASRCIFAEKHDAEGMQMPVYRLGQNVKLQDAFAQKLANPQLERREARGFAHDFHELLGLKHRLASQKLTDEEGAKLQARYNELLNQYFVVN